MNDGAELLLPGLRVAEFRVTAGVSCLALTTFVASGLASQYSRTCAANQKVRFVLKPWAGNAAYKLQCILFRPSLNDPYNVPVLKYAIQIALPGAAAR